ncbi:MAG: ABC transporter permease [SAR324 cluster bacterium]|nr:ABC transporter permease [SAR324 cluster bacterium]
MLVYILKRSLLLIPVMLGISLVVFVIMALIPGDPALAILGAYATPENIADINQRLGLDKSMPEQYLNWIGNLLNGDFGRSYHLNRPVSDEILERLFPTLLLAGVSLLLCIVFGILIGLFSAIRQYQWPDQILTLFSLIGISTPSFWLGLMLVLFFSVKWQLLPASGMYSIYGDEGWLDLLEHIVMPALTLALVATGVVSRMTRTNMLESLRQDYIRTARAKGIRESKVIYRHALKNALVNIIPVLGLQAGFVLGGAVYIETVFQWPGIGRMLVQAITTRDILLVQGGVVVVAFIYVLINLLTDILQQSIDPRIRL